MNIRRVVPVLGLAVTLLVFAMFTVIPPAVPILQARGVATKTPKINKIVLENQRPGTTNWKVPGFSHFKDEESKEKHLQTRADRGSNPDANSAQWSDTQEIKGYAGKTSIDHGQAIDLYVSTTAASYTLDIYRSGWYGGTGG